jgi:hypothetical protein
MPDGILELYYQEKISFCVYECIIIVSKQKIEKRYRRFGRRDQWQKAQIEVKNPFM